MKKAESEVEKYIRRNRQAAEYYWKNREVVLAKARVKWAEKRAPIRPQG